MTIQQLPAEVPPPIPTKMKTFLERPGVDFSVERWDAPDPYGQILDWALNADHGGGLPLMAARPFADWISKVWDDWCEDETATVKDILEGAITDFCGGRVMPV